MRNTIHRISEYYRSWGDPPIIAYFDTNVFDHLEQRIGVTEQDLYRLGRAVKLEYLRVVLSFLNLEEILFIAQSKPERAKAQLKLIFELADKRLFVLGQEEIMNNDIRAYAHQTPSKSPFTLMSVGMEMDIRNLINDPESLRREYDRIVRQTRRAKESFLNMLIKGQRKLKPMAAEIGVRQYPFERYWANNSGWLVEGLAKRVGELSKAKQRGTDGLLKVKSVSVAVGANLSLLYSHHFDGHAPSAGDSRDMLHALLASTADIFVTNDKKLEIVLARIQTDGFRVMNLRNFITDLPHWI